MCGGDCWEIKDKIGGKQISGGQKFWGGGTFGGNAKKEVEKLFGGVLGSFEPQQISGGNFLKNVKEKNLGGKFCGVVRRGRAMR